MILTEAANFDRYPDGRLRAGPFPQSREEIERLLFRHGLRPGPGQRSGFCSKTAMGIMISCAGPGVMGYMLDTDGLEAPSSDLEAFLEDVVTPGISFIIEGHHCPDADRMICSKLSAWRLDGTLMVASSRVLESRGAGRRILHHHAPMPVSRACGARMPRPYLVG